MKLLRIKDNSQQKKDAFSQVARLTGKIADKTLEQLEREGVFVFPETVKDAEDITQDHMILQSVNDTYRSGNVMGFLGYGDERLVIASRFCGEGEDYFFQYLLDKVLDFPNIVDLDADANQDNRLFNFLLFLFPYSGTLSEYKNAMEMLWQRRDEYDLTWPGHHAKPVEKDIILQFIEAAELLGEGKLASRVCESPFGSYRLAEYKDVGIEF